MYNQNLWNSPASVLAHAPSTTNNLPGGGGPLWGSAVPNFSACGTATTAAMTGHSNDGGSSSSGSSSSGSSSLDGSSKGMKRKASVDDDSAMSRSISPEPRDHHHHHQYHANGESLHHVIGGITASVPSADGGSSSSSSSSGNSTLRSVRKHKSLHNLRRHRPYDENAPLPRNHAIRSKRTRMLSDDDDDDAVAAAPPAGLSLEKLLDTLDKEDLVKMIVSLSQKYPYLSEDITSIMPKPTVTAACKQLAKLERKLQNSFPYNKEGIVLDDYTFSRVSPALKELRNTIIMYVDYFTHQGLESTASASGGDKHPGLTTPTSALSHPCEWFTLLDNATTVATRMPQWNNEEYDSIRKDVLRQLSDGWLRAIIATCRWLKEGQMVGHYIVAEWERSLSFHAQTSGMPNLFQPATHAFSHHMLPILNMPSSV